MAMTEQDEPAADRSTEPHLEITLHAEPDGFRWVRSVVATLGPARVRVSFQSRMALDAAFRPEAAEEIGALCRDAAPQEGVLSLPDLCLSLGGLLIRSAVILVHRAADGARQILIRARKVVGSALALFRPEVIASDGPAIRYEQLASMAVEKFFLPIANLNHLLDEVIWSGNADSQARVLKSLERLRAHTLALQAAFAGLVAEIRGLETDETRDETPRVAGLAG
jgi:hypothetical protein